ncbi:MAG: alpha/beta hydrolase [Eubacterium sp.]
MIHLDQQHFHATDDAPVYYYTTPCNLDTQGVLIIVHGMAEYALRYQEFADFLYRKGFIVYALDQRGHGATGTFNGTLGYFDDTNGWKRIVEDIRELTYLAKSKNPDLPLFILGHSMGSIVVRSCLIEFGNFYNGAVIVGTTLGVNSFMRKIGETIALFEIRKYGPTHPSTLLEKISFGNYNKNFNPNRTAYDWLSADTDNVDRYLSDPLCGFTCTSSFYYDFFTGLDFTNAIKHIQKMPKTLPLYLISGASDPVSFMGKEVKILYKRMKKAGIQDIELTLYPGKRHEILNESNRKDIYQDILKFLQNKH